ncbi:response regulator [Candidatus Uhrbacteria bacterium]|nr:response regulator [Candidatus Uhrbacteria bacterium]
MPETKKIHILLADDDPVMLQLFGGQLAAKGFELLYAHDGAECWEMARRLNPELILLDYRMPSMDGIETATHLKGEDATKNIPILMLTNEDFWPDTVKSIKEIGIAGYIHKGKPFSEIFGRVKEVLKQAGIEYVEPPKS